MNKFFQSAIAFKTAAALVAAAVSIPAAFAEDRSLFLKTNSVKDYGKRDRVFLSSDQTVSPSQMHELYGTRVDAGIELDTATASYPGERAKSYAPTATARAFWGADIVSLGLGGSLAESKLNSNNISDFSENQTSRKLLPSLATTISPNITIGIASDANWILVDQKANNIEEQSFDTFVRREMIGISWHNPKMEFGFAYATPATASASSNKSNTNAGEFGLLAPASPDRRDVYLAAHRTTCARGNLTDNFSLQGTITHVQYDDNVAAAKRTFADYRMEDRVASQLQGVYWANDRATRLAATASYKGATYAAFGTEDTGLGYRDVNLYGATVDGAVALQKRTYLGLSLGYLRGERDQAIDGNNVSATEVRTKIATTLNINL